VKFTLQIVCLKFAIKRLIPDKGALSDVITQIVRSEFLFVCLFLAQHFPSGPEPPLSRSF